jgi:tetratricopeptide (TPR) repeat protein
MSQSPDHAEEPVELPEEPRRWPFRLEVWDRHLLRWRWAWIALTLAVALWFWWPRFADWQSNAADQGRYLTFADNIRRGNWNWSGEYEVVGSNTAGFTTFQPPLFPLLTGLVGLMTGEVQMAGTIVNALSGLLTILFAILIALRLATPLTALLAGVAIAFHPLIVNFSTNRYLEICFTACTLGAVLTTLWAVERPQPQRLLAAGVVWALASLARFEGQNLFALTFLFLLWRVRPIRALWALGGFLAIMVPIKIWALLATPADSPNIALPLQILMVIRNGWPLGRAAFDIDPQGHLITVEMARQASLLSYLWHERAFFAVFMGKNLAGPIPALIAAHLLPAKLWIPAVLGGLLLLWRDRRESDGRYVVAVALAPLFYLALTDPTTRYFINIVPLWLILAAFALVACTGLACHLLGRLRLPRSISATAALLILALAGWTWGNRAFQPTDYYSVSSYRFPAQNMRILAAILRASSPSAEAVAAHSAGLGWMSGVRQSFFPYGRRAETLRYLRQANVNYVMVDAPLFRRVRPIQEVFTDPSAVSDDLELVAIDPNCWYYLYHVRPASDPGASPPDLAAAHRLFVETAEKVCGADFLSQSYAHLPQESREALLPDALQRMRDLLAQGDTEAALRAARWAWTVEPRSELALEAYTGGLVSTGRENQAIDVWIKTLSDLPESGAESVWAIARRRLGERGISVTDALRRGEASSWQCHLIARWLERLRMPDEALGAWDLALQADTPPLAEYQLGRHRALMRLGRYEEALEAAEQARLLEPRHPWALLYVGDALSALGNAEQARQSWLAAQRVSADSSFHDLVHTRLGGQWQPPAMTTYRFELAVREAVQAQASSEWERSLDASRRAAEIDPESGAAQGLIATAASHLGLDDVARQAWVKGVCLITGGDAEPLWAEARAWLSARGISMEQALAEGEASAWQCHLVAQWLYRQRAFEEALAAWDQALAVGPPNVEYELGRHRCLMQLERPAEALTAAQQALSIEPRHGWAELYIGDALAALGRGDEAREHWRACLECPIDAGSHSAARQRLSEQGAGGT